MTAEQKRLFFRHLVKCGFKEIEVAHPSSSDTEFEFVRSLITCGEIPEDVGIQVRSGFRHEHLCTWSLARTNLVDGCNVGDDPSSGGSHPSYLRGDCWCAEGDY